MLGHFRYFRFRAEQGRSFPGRVVISGFFPAGNRAVLDGKGPDEYSPSSETSITTYKHITGKFSGRAKHITGIKLDMLS